VVPPLDLDLGYRKALLLDGETREGCSSARLWSLITPGESNCSHIAEIDFEEHDLRGAI
jgi:hypothetical protein